MNVLDHRHKLFYALTVLGCLANFIWFIICKRNSGWAPVTVLCLICASAAFICSFAGIIFDYITASSLIMILMLNLIEFPLLFYYLGTSAAAYLLLGLFTITAYVTGNFRIVLYIFTGLIHSLLIFLDLHPAGVAAMDTASKSVLLYAYIVSAVAIFSMTTIIESQYENQNVKIMHMTKKLEQDANVDPLTRVYNRRFMMRTLEMTLQHQNTFYISLLDIDNFKSINDTYGHVYGDDILKELGRLMKTNSPSDVIVSRYGGEEFFMLYRNEDQEDVFKIINSIKDSLGEYSMATKHIKVTFSCGVVRATRGSRAASLITRVDEKLYLAKKNGKDRIEI